MHDISAPFLINIFRGFKWLILCKSATKCLRISISVVCGVKLDVSHSIWPKLNDGGKIYANSKSGNSPFLVSCIKFVLLYISARFSWCVYQHIVLHEITTLCKMQCNVCTNEYRASNFAICTKPHLNVSMCDVVSSTHDHLHVYECVVCIFTMLFLRVNCSRSVVFHNIL